jgi:hypothetical protein
VATRFQAHLLQQRLRPALVLGACKDARAHLLQARREAVANALELGEVEQPRAAARAGERRVVPARRRVRGRGDVGKAVGHDRRELALDPRDLGPQRPPGGELVDIEPGCDPAAIDDWLLLLAHPASSL